MANEPGEWADRLQTFHAKSGGCFSAHLVRQSEMLNVLKAAQSDPEAERLAYGVQLFVHQVATEPDTATCLSCETRISLDTLDTIFIILADDRSAPGIFVPICRDCSDRYSDAGLLEQLVRQLRVIWGDVRAKTVTHPEGGHA